MPTPSRKLPIAGTKQALSMEQKGASHPNYNMAEAATGRQFRGGVSRFESAGAPRPQRPRAAC